MYSLFSMFPQGGVHNRCLQCPLARINAMVVSGRISSMKFNAKRKMWLNWVESIHFCIAVNRCTKQRFRTDDILEIKCGIAAALLAGFLGRLGGTTLLVQHCASLAPPPLRSPLPPCTERAMPSLSPMGLAWCNGLPTTHYSYKVSANHTIDPVIPPIWDSLPRLAVSMSEARVSASLPASFPVVLPAFRCLWGGDWDLRNLSPSQLCFLFGIHLV